MTPAKPTLTDLARQFGTDKFFRHSYMPHYEALLGKRKVKRLLEVGIGYRDLMQPFLPEGVEYIHGASLKMWSTYWPEAEIWGCDIREDTLINEGNIRSVVCDQSSPASLMSLVRETSGQWDVVVDDGSHNPSHQALTASILLPHLAKGGIMITEDCYPDTGAALARRFGGQLIVGTKCPDDCLVVFER